MKKNKYGQSELTLREKRSLLIGWFIALALVMGSALVVEALAAPEEIKSSIAEVRR